MNGVLIIAGLLLFTLGVGGCVVSWLGMGHAFNHRRRLNGWGWCVFVSMNLLCSALALTGLVMIA